MQARRLELLIGGEDHTSHTLIFMQQFVLSGHYLSERVVSTCCDSAIGTGPAGSEAGICQPSGERGRFI